VTRKRMPSQREQYGNTVHLFIGTGRSPCKITSRPFAFDNNSIVIYLGLDSLFLFKSVSSFLPSCRSSLAHSFGSVPSFVLFPCFFIPWALVRRSLSTHYTPEALLNHVLRTFGSRRPPTGRYWRVEDRARGWGRAGLIHGCWARARASGGMPMVYTIALIYSRDLDEYA
jgi:hypothetical protein